MLPKNLQITDSGRQQRIGSVGQPVVIEETRFAWPGLEFRTSTQDISQSTDWKIHEPRHVVIVHLGGRMDELETELGGRGGSSGPAIPGEVWTVPADLPYASHAKGGIIRFAVLSILPEDQHCGTKRGRDSGMIAPISGSSDEVLTNAVEQLVRVSREADDVSQMQAESLADSITRHVFQVYGTASWSQSAGSREGLILASHETRLLREFIFDNLGSPLSLDALAALVGMTTHQLLVAFRVAFGTTPAQYVIMQRLRRAQWHLLYSELDITSIALVTGFSSHSHLTSAFTRRFGYPPQMFREKHTAWEHHSCLTARPNAATPVSPWHD